MEYERHYVWSVPLRIFHWVFALSFTGLVITGLYIHWPWTNTMLEGTNRFPMAVMRDIHFQLGYYFLASILLRYYLLLFGNKQERFTDFFPISISNIKSIPKTIIHYLYLSEEHEEKPGHNCYAGLFFSFIFLLSLFQIISGLYLLYPESPFWQGIGLSLFCSQQYARLVHYFSTYLFLMFTIAHIYIVFWNDIKCCGGITSSIINGYKFFPKNKAP